MNLKEVMGALGSMGTAQNRNVYARHGVGPNLFGVSYAGLGKLRKTLGVDHDLARQLWATGNHDARVLATMIADPRQTGPELLDAWVRDLDNSVVTDAFAKLAAQSPKAVDRAGRWMRAPEEWVGRAGWRVASELAVRDPELPDAFFDACLETIAREIHTRQNRVRDAMNAALIAIGLRNAGLERKALTAARSIGRVEVDHGETGCKTPDAAAYIAKAKQRRAGAAGAKARAGKAKPGTTSRTSAKPGGHARARSQRARAAAGRRSRRG